MVAWARLNAGVSEGKPRTQAAVPWDTAASICQGTNSHRPGLRGQCHFAVPRARKGEGTRGKGQPEVCLPASGSGAWSVKRVTCSSPAFPQQAPGAQLLLYPSRMLGMQCQSGAVGAQHCHRCFWLLDCTHCSGLWLSAGADGHLEKYWLSCYILGGLGKCRRHRIIITPCFLTPSLHYHLLSVGEERDAQKHQTGWGCNPLDSNLQETLSRNTSALHNLSGVGMPL